MIRRATAQDADAIAHVLTAAHAAQSWFPRLHTPDEERAFVREQLLPGHEAWVAEEDGRVVGFIVVWDGVLHHLFVHPEAQGSGIGSALLEKTQEICPNGFTLWTHQANEQARRFYEARGLVAVELTDGQGNEEKMPDVRYEWKPVA